jgi:hypothetical protein
MNTTTESENASAPEVPLSKTKRTPAKSRRQAEGGSRQQEGRSDRVDEALQRRNAG